MYLAIEIGGTKLQAAVGDGNGTIVKSARVAAQPKAGREGICNQIERLAVDLLNQPGVAGQKITACGIGFGGPVDSKHGIVLKSHQVSGWDDFPIVEWFRERFKMPTALGNDSDMAGWAEALFGAGKGFSPIVYMNIGSGIGGAFVIDGKLYSGQGLGSTEIGHLRIAPDGPGKPWRTLESLCSGWALAEQAKSIAGLSSDANAGDLAKAATAGNLEAQKVWSTAIERLGVAIANVITLLHPERVVLGGGVALIGDSLLHPLRTAVRLQAFAPFRDTVEIVPAALGEEVVLYGALKLACDTAD